MSGVETMAQSVARHVERDSYRASIVSEALAKSLQQDGALIASTSIGWLWLHREGSLHKSETLARALQRVRRNHR